MKKRRLFLEGLERRELFAGNVLVEVTRGTLQVTGDGVANHIAIYQQANGTFDITGLDEEVFTGPTTNILARNITVNLGAGDDSVVIGAQPTEGGDSLPASVLGTTTVNGGDGSDNITVSVLGRQVNTLVLPALSLSIDGGTPAAGAGPQNDNVSIAGSSAALVSVKTGVGDDVVDLSNVTAVMLTVVAGPDNTSVTDADIVTGLNLTAATANVKLGLNNSANTLDIDTGLFGTLEANGGNGVDTVLLSGIRAGLSLTLSTYEGADIVNLGTLQTGLTRADYLDIAGLVLGSFGISLNSLPFNLTTLINVLPNLPGTMTISTGGGADVVVANNLYSTFALYMYLDAGNDQLFADTVHSDFFAWFYGGADTDGRCMTNVTALSELELQFETVLAPVQGL